MILKNNLYEIKQVDVIDKKVILRLIPDCLIYQAHFPEQPITPGVCIIQMATEAVSELLCRHVALDSVSNAKFLAVINPTETREIEISFKKLDINEDLKILKASVIVSNEKTTFSKLSLSYTL